MDGIATKHLKHNKKKVSASEYSDADTL